MNVKFYLSFWFNISIYCFNFYNCFNFFLNNKHLLSLLLSLEALMMSLFCLAVISMSPMNVGYYYSLIILTFAACEAAVGLSILVNMISSHGSSYVGSMNLMQC
uniref:NADH-ubiquinone oxidoreductase chain 4L n=1 Tax=Loxosomella aloxiata TaxID=393182 RepID=B1B1X7_9BILA|nr:NADH dehydrogenase subunit 4L [Loxosomella aloxiata]BAG12592.1 NADH dehydrogenase subunit 4L [Loxosomella aloxiata]